jgi:protein-tyrosine phosphatase
MTIGILFICTSNICRSPMAEGVFRNMARRAGLAAAFTVDSAGTFDGYVGRPPAPLAIKAAALRGYDIAGLRARQVGEADIVRFDHVLAMDRCHLADLRWIAPRALFERLQLFTSFDPSSERLTSPTHTAVRWEITSRHWISLKLAATAFSRP